MVRDKSAGKVEVVEKKRKEEQREEEQEVIIDGSSEMESIQGGLFSLYGKLRFLLNVFL